MRRSLFLVVFSLAGAMLVLFIVLPLVSTLLSTSPFAFIQALGDPEIGSSLGLTFAASGIATIFGLLTGLPLAYLLARASFPGKRLVESIVDLPIVIPHTAAGIALLLVFGSEGILGKGFASIGLIFTDTLAGIVVAMAFVSLPYLVNLCRESFALVEPEMERAALVDGASPWQAFWYVTLPQAWRGVLSGVLMMWARGISEFGAVVILAYNPKIVPVLVYERFEGLGLTAAQPVALLLILVVLAVFILLRSSLIYRKDRSAR
ncbi:MAG: ABC transporter permease [Anaerolineaceae bacterium]|nr:ABC transporter permease [Anaerolineaceae bacterium]